MLRLAMDTHGAGMERKLQTGDSVKDLSSPISGRVSDAGSSMRGVERSCAFSTQPIPAVERLDLKSCSSHDCFTIMCNLDVIRELPAKSFLGNLVRQGRLYRKPVFRAVPSRRS